MKRVEVGGGDEDSRHAGEHGSRQHPHAASAALDRIEPLHAGGSLQAHCLTHRRGLLAFKPR
jgi:hypothetical protein